MTQMQLQEYLHLWRSAQRVMDDFDPHYSVQPEESRVLFDLAVQVEAGGLIVELGVCNGRTSAMFATVAQANQVEFVGVDFFGLESSREVVQVKLEKHNLPGLIIDADTRILGKSWRDSIDLLFIDAGHDEANVGEDARLWVPWVKPGGVVAFHDYGDRTGAHEAVSRHADLATQGWEILPSNSVMLVARRPGGG